MDVSTKDSPVVVTADEIGNVIIRSNKNPLYGYIRVEQMRMEIDDTGFMRRKVISALVPGLVEDLLAFGWKAGEKISGKIVVRESLTPFNKKDVNRDLKIAGNTGIVCKVDSSPIYRKKFYTLSSVAQDVLIEHNNIEEIRAAQALITEDIKNSDDLDF